MGRYGSVPGQGIYLADPQTLSITKAINFLEDGQE